ncbi:MAG TPA: hypothetical protein VNJ07_07790 [Chitinophagales bacterium]|nr:hypothetical protein [Chitinophagales bacterium]
MLQPVFALLFWLSFPVGFWWKPWWYILAIASGLYIFLIIAEACKYSAKMSDVPTVSVLILAGNILPGAGFILKALGILPSLHSFYRNDKH